MKQQLTFMLSEITKLEPTEEKKSIPYVISKNTELKEEMQQKLIEKRKSVFGIRRQNQLNIGRMEYADKFKR